MVEVCGLGDGNATFLLSLSVPLASPFSHFYPLGAVVQRGVGEYSNGGMGGLDGHCIVHHNDAFYSSRNSYASSATFRPRVLLKRAFEGKNLEVPPVSVRHCSRYRIEPFAQRKSCLLPFFLPLPLAWSQQRKDFGA